MDESLSNLPACTEGAVDVFPTEVNFVLELTTSTKQTNQIHLSNYDYLCVIANWKIILIWETNMQQNYLFCLLWHMNVWGYFTMILQKKNIISISLFQQILKRTVLSC